MTNDEQTTSAQIDIALAMEEYHRDWLLFWRQRRTRLEQLINEPIDELSEIAERAFNADRNDNQG